jgi:response regulator of citrate/malate metabolism
VSARPIRVLVVDDEVITASAHAEYVRRLDGFEVAGIAHNGREALRQLHDSATDATEGSKAIDLVLLDMNLPDTHGLDLCRRIRSAGVQVDVIAITAVREVSVVRASVSLGVVLYVIKPFTFATFAEKLRGYLAFREGLDGTAGITTQSDVDQTMARLRAPTRILLDKGLSTDTLDRIVRLVSHSDAGVSANELGSELEISRITARRYLEHLVDQGCVERAARYGTPGRPELEYRWRNSA